MNKSWDAIVIGAGAAGLSAAQMLGRSRRKTLVIDAGSPRNRFAAHMHGVLGHDGIAPDDLLTRGRVEVAAYGVEVRQGSVASVSDTGSALEVHLTDGSHLTARALVVATGITDQLPTIPGLAEHWGSGVLHCPYCHGWEVRDQQLGVIAMPPMGLHQAQLVRQWSADVTVFTGALGEIADADRNRLRSRGVNIVDEEVTEVLGRDGALVGVRTAAGRVIELDALFTSGVALPHDHFLADLNLQRDEGPFGSFIAVDAMGTTSHPRVWAAGNITNPNANVPMAMGAGAMAGSAANMALVADEFDQADAATHWESEYADNGPRWSGHVNATVASVVSELPAGAVLELGCGEGGDALWFAEHGWQVTAVDISPTAVERGRAAAVSRGLDQAITWVAHDLASWETDQEFDLVTAAFFHSAVDHPRTAILRRAADTIRPGGHLLIVSHLFESDADVPPWAARHREESPHSHYRLLSPTAEIEALGLDPNQWETVLTESRFREAVGPDGVERAQVKDGVVLVRRKP